MRSAVQFLTVTVLALAAGPVFGQALPEEPEEAKSRAMSWATDTAKVAGAASYCALDVDAVEHYTALAQAKIAAIANDKVDRVVAKIEFGNVFNVASSQEPDGGCENFAQLFAQEANKLE